MMNFDSPAALGLSLEGGVGMGISMSGLSALGLGSSQMGMGRGDEDERRRRLESVIATLKAKPGRVSEEGIIGLCKKEGLEVLRDQQGKREENRIMLTLLIGSEAMCEVCLHSAKLQTEALG